MRIIPTVIDEENGKKISMDLFSRILKDRIITLFDDVNDITAELVCSQMIYLDSVSNEPIKLYINSPGGSVIDGLAIVDTMNLIKSEVHTYCIGQAASMGAILLMCGEKEYRHCTANSRIMIHQISGGASGKGEDIKVTVKEIERLEGICLQLMSDATGKTVKQLEKDQRLDNYMDPNKAKLYGIVDKVLGKTGAA